jgi:hypothetical protein
MCDQGHTLLFNSKKCETKEEEKEEKIIILHFFRRGRKDINLCIKVEHDSLTIIEVYTDDIIFISDDDRLSQKFVRDMQSEFEMSLFGS